MLVLVGMFQRDMSPIRACLDELAAIRARPGFVDYVIVHIALIIGQLNQPASFMLE